MSFSDDGRYLSLGGVGEDGNGVLMPLKTKNFPNLPKQQNVTGFVNDVQILGRQGLYLTASEEALTAWKMKLWAADDT